MPISSTLPVAQEPYVTKSAGLPTYFAGLLPEGHRLAVLAGATKTSLDDELTLLLAVGQDTPGDVQVVPEDVSPRDEEPLLSQQFSEVDFKKLTESVDLQALPGFQDKASATMVNTPVRTDSGFGILKIDPPKHKHLVLNEQLHLRSAQRLKIPVTDHTVVHDKYDKPGLYVHRFDRVIPGSNLHRLTMEDAAQALDILPAKKYAVETSDAIIALASLTDTPLFTKRNLYL